MNKENSNFRKKIIDNKYYSIFFTLIILLTLFMRFYNIFNRWGFGTDQTAFAIVSLYALKTFQLPLLGPFSSAGPFQTGGEWYWFVMLGQLFNPFWIYSPWLFLSVVYIGIVLLMIYIGTLLIDKWFGLVVGLLTGISTSQVLQSTNLTNQSPITLFSALSILFAIFYIRTQKLMYLFLMTLSISLAASIHLQGVSLLSILLVTCLFGKFPRVKGMLIILLALIIPWVPVIISDFGHNFFNFKNMYYYFFFEKNKPSFEVLNRRWVTFIFNFIPQSWGYIIGGYTFVGYAISCLTVGTLLTYLYYKRNVAREWSVIIVSTLIMLTIVRYTRTPIFESYLMIINPHFLLLTAASIYILIKTHKYIGYSILVILIVTTSFRNMNDILHSQTNTSYVNTIKKHLYSISHDNVSLYDYKYQSLDSAFALVLSLYIDGKIDDKGRKIGYVVSPSQYKLSKVLYREKNIYELVDLQNLDEKILEKQGWHFINPSEIYNTTENWYKK